MSCGSGAGSEGVAGAAGVSDVGSGAGALSVGGVGTSTEGMSGLVA